MEKRSWGFDGIETSLLGFGCMRFKTVNGEIDEEKAMALVDKAYNAGVNYFDTALPYTDGKNESFVGKALKRYPRESFYLATKFSMPCFKTKEEALKSIDIQLANLQTDYIDFYLVHALSKERLEQFKEWNMMEVLETWKKAGKIRYIGFSFHDGYEAFVEVLNYYKWDFAQIQLNYMDTDIQQGIKGYYDLEKKNIPVIVMEPIKGGKLASFNKNISKDFTDYSSNSIASWALRWVGSFDGVKVILSGMNEDDQLTDNLKTFSKFEKLSTEENKIVESVVDKLKKVNRVGCTGCKYCMPCPKGVNIAQMFKIYNDYAMYENQNSSKWLYSLLKNKKEDYKECVNCKMCISKCPQGIDIPNVFALLEKEMDFLNNDSK